VPVRPLADKSDEQTVRLTGNATVEWDGADDAGRPGDVAQLQLDYESPYREFEGRFGAHFLPVLSYTHNLSSSVALTATIKGIGPLRVRDTISAALLQQISVQTQTLPELKMKVVKSLGNGR
jgi:hypothetical protein